MKSSFFTILLSFTALVVAFFAAYFSVFGLGQLFVGAWLMATILFSALEFGKLVTISYLNQFWQIMNKKLRLWLSIIVIFLMIITSIGIYGFLSSAYTKTSSDMDVVNSNISLIDKKIEIKERERKSIEEIIKQKNERIKTLNDLRKSQEVRLDSLYMRGRIQAAKQTEASIQKASDDIDKCNTDIATQNDKISVINDSLSTYEMSKTEQNQSSAARDVGTLKYVAKSFGLPMDTVVTILILLIMFVFDPFSVALIIAANETSKRIGKKKKENKLETDSDPDVEEEPESEEPSIWSKLLTKIKPKKKDKVEDKEEKVEEEYPSFSESDIPFEEPLDEITPELPNDFYDEPESVKDDITLKEPVVSEVIPEFHYEIESVQEEKTELIDDVEVLEPTTIETNVLIEEKREPLVLEEYKPEEPEPEKKIEDEDLNKIIQEKLENILPKNGELDNIKKKVDENIDTVKDDINNVKGDINNVKETVESTKEDINSLKSNVDEIKETTETMKEEINSNIESVKDEIMNSVQDTMENMFDKMKDMMESMNDKKKDEEEPESIDREEDDFWDVKEVEDGSVYPVFNTRDYIANSEVKQVVRNYKEFKNLKWISFPSATQIEPYIFLDCSKLESVDLPLVTSTEGSFKNCIKLKEVNMPKLTMVGEYTFYNCQNLESLELPNAKIIDDYAFGHCTKLEYLDISNANVFGDNIFDGIKDQKIKIKMKKEFIDDDNFVQLVTLNDVEFEFV